MDSRNIQNSSVQFDYFSENFIRFEQDFNAYSNLVVPLTFMVDDILFTMNESQTNYFKLPAMKAKDNKNHYFIFRVKMQESNSQVRIYEYIRHTSPF